MTYGSVPTLRHAPDIAAQWLPKIYGRDYDKRFMTVGHKSSALLGMGMTENQGGSDLRQTQTTAAFAGRHGDARRLDHVDIARIPSRPNGHRRRDASYADVLICWGFAHGTAGSLPDRLWSFERVKLGFQLAHARLAHFQEFRERDIAESLVGGDTCITAAIAASAVTVAGAADGLKRASTAENVLELARRDLAKHARYFIELSENFFFRHCHLLRLRSTSGKSGRVTADITPPRHGVPFPVLTE
jgi:hypothetical protein